MSALFGELAATPFAMPQPEDDAPPETPREAVLHKAREQAHLVIGFRGLALDDDDRFALDLVSQILAGQSGRLFLELRDRRSLAYSVTAVNVEAVVPGFFAVYIGTAPEKLDEARRCMMDELERLLASPPTAAELLAAQRHLRATS